MKGGVCTELLRCERELNLLPLVSTERRQERVRGFYNSTGLAIRKRVVNRLSLDFLESRSRMAESQRECDSTGEHDHHPHISSVLPRRQNQKLAYCIL
jgi:hypothetical protein